MTGPGHVPRNARSDARSGYAKLDNRLFGDDLLRLAVARAAAATSACSRLGPVRPLSSPGARIATGP